MGLFGAGAMAHMGGMDQKSLTALAIGAAAVLLIVGFMFSARIEQGINHAAYLEATQQSAVPTPPALAPAKHKPS